MSQQGMLSIKSDYFDVRWLFFWIHHHSNLCWTLYMLSQRTGSITTNKTGCKCNIFTYSFLADVLYELYRFSADTQPVEANICNTNKQSCEVTARLVW